MRFANSGRASIIAAFSNSFSSISALFLLLLPEIS